VGFHSTSALFTPLAVPDGRVFPCKIPCKQGIVFLAGEDYRWARREPWAKQREFLREWAAVMLKIE
jgi:hypothetical protein